MEGKKSEEHKFCKRVTFNRPNSPYNDSAVILGIQIHEDFYFIKIKTGKGKEYIIQKKQIVLIEDTDIIFQEVPK